MINEERPITPEKSADILFQVKDGTFLYSRSPEPRNKRNVPQVLLKCCISCNFSVVQDSRGTSLSLYNEGGTCRQGKKGMLLKCHFSCQRWGVFRMSKLMLIFASFWVRFSSYWLFYRYFEGSKQQEMDAKKGVGGRIPCYKKKMRYKQIQIQNVLLIKRTISSFGHSMTAKHSLFYSAETAWTSVKCFLCLHIQANIGFKRDKRHLIAVKYLPLDTLNFNN